MWYVQCAVVCLDPILGALGLPAGYSGLWRCRLPWEAMGVVLPVVWSVAVLWELGLAYLELVSLSGSQWVEACIAGTCRLHLIWVCSMW